MSAIRLKAIVGSDVLQVTNPTVLLSSTATNAFQVAGGGSFIKPLSLNEIQPLTSDGTIKLNSLTVYGPTHPTYPNQVDITGNLTVNGQDIAQGGSDSSPSHSVTTLTVTGGSQAIPSMVFATTSFLATVNVVLAGTTTYRSIYELQGIKRDTTFTLTQESTGYEMDLAFSIDSSGQIFVVPGPAVASSGSSLTITWRAKTMTF